MPSKALEKYLSHYQGTNDLHLKPLRFIKNKYKVKRVLYAGSWIHLTPSLIFPYVVYVDSSTEMKSLFTDSELIEYIESHSETTGKPVIRFHQIDYRKGIKEEKEESFDLLLSLSSGFVSQYCKAYLRSNGLLFVNDEHYDASMAYVDSSFSLIGVFSYPENVIEKKERIEEYFLTKRNQPITVEMVRENSERPPSKAKHKLMKKAPFFLFQKV